MWLKGIHLPAYFSEVLGLSFWAWATVDLC